MLYPTQLSIPLDIAGRSNWGDYSSVSQFVTPIESVVRQAVSAAGSFSTRGAEGIDDEGTHRAAKQIWGLLNGLNIDYISDPTLEYRQYPAEVLKTKRGDCDDLATLYVALLESVGIKTALVTHPGHMYAGYYDSKYIYPIETTMMGSSFDNAMKEGLKEYGEHENDRLVTKIEEEWKSKNIKTPGDVGIASNEVSFPFIEVHLSQSSEWQCDSPSQWGCQHYIFLVYCDLTFINTGNDEGQKCVDVYTYLDHSDTPVQKKVACETVDVNDQQETHVTYTNNNPNPEGHSYLCEIE